MLNLGVISKFGRLPMKNIEDAKQILVNEFNDAPYTRNDLLGNAACNRKIKDLIICYILNRISQAECEKEIRTLMIDSKVLEEKIENDILPLIDMYYKAKELVDAGYFINL